MIDTFLTDRAWLWIAAALYLSGFVRGTLALAMQKRHSRSLMYFIMAAGFIVQTIGMYTRGRSVGGCPIGNTFEILQFTTWSATALYLVIGATFRLSLLGYFTAGFSTLLSIVSLALPSLDFARRIKMAEANPWIEIHAGLALFSYGVFGMLALTSLMFLLQWFSLKRQRLHGIFSFLPPIRDLDLINVRLLGMGALLLGASLGVGSVTWIKMPSTSINLAVVFLGCLWLMYASALVCRLTNTISARWLARVCIALFALAIATLGAVTRHGDNPSSEYRAQPVTSDKNAPLP